MHHLGFFQHRRGPGQEPYRPAGSVLFSVMPIMQQHSTVPPPVWNGPRIPANLFQPWQLQPMQTHPLHAGSSGSHASLRRTLSTPCRKRVSEYRSLFTGDTPRESSPLFNHDTPCSMSVTKATSSPIEIPDSPSSLSVITISSSSDEMEPNSLENSGIEPSLVTSAGNDYTTSAADEYSASAGNEDGEEQDDQEGNQDQQQQEDNFDGFGDDEEEDEEEDDDCIVTSSFSIGSASPGINDFSANQHPCYRGNADDDVVSSTTDMPRGDSSIQGNGRHVHCSDTESADEKGDTHDDINDIVHTRNDRHDNHRHRHSHQASSRSRPSPLGVYSHYSTPNMQTAGPFISTALPYGPQQTLLVPGREQRCCVSDVYQEPVFLLPPTHAQTMQQPLFAGINSPRVPSGAPGPIPYTYVNQTSSGTGAFIAPLSQGPGLISRGNLQTPMQNGLSLTGQTFPGQMPYTNPVYQAPVFGGLKTYNVVPNGSTGPYGPFVLNSSPTKGRIFFP